MSAEIKPKYSISTFGNYTTLDTFIQISDKTSSFRSGAIGARLDAEFGPYFNGYIAYGLGYSPKETATFAGASVSGNATSRMSLVGSELVYPFYSTSVGIRFDRLSYKMGGDFSGTRNSAPVTADVTGELNMTRVSATAAKQVTEDVFIRFGVGRYKWSLSALAVGELSGSITARTSATTDGHDGFWHATGIWELNRDWFLRGDYARYELTTTNKPTVYEYGVALGRRF